MSSFGKRKDDGRYYPKGGKARTLQTDRSQTIGTMGTKPKRRHFISRKRREALRTLENDMLYQPFIQKMEQLNPGTFDAASMIDRTLTPEEMLRVLREKHKLDIGLKEKDNVESFREFLDDMGINHARLQNMVAMQDNPLSQDELNNLAYIVQMRSDHAKKTDKALKAPVTTDLREWMKTPARVDIRGVDSPGSK